MTEFTPEWIELYKMVFTENEEKMFSNATSLEVLDEIQRLQSRVQELEVQNAIKMEVLRDIFHTSNEENTIEIATNGLKNSGEIIMRGE